MKELVAEVKELVYKEGKRLFKWLCPKGKRNEGTDCTNYAYAALLASKQRDRLNLEKLSNELLGTSYELSPRRKNTKKKKAGAYGGI